MANRNSLENFDFKLYITGLLCKSLSDPVDQEISQQWINKLNKNNKKDGLNILNIHILDLLVTSLQGIRLVEPFKKPPSTNAELVNFACKYSIGDIKNLLLFELFQETIDKEPKTPLPMDRSSYAIFKCIPGFGGHFYYTSSPLRIRSVDDLKKMCLPVGSTIILPAYSGN